MGTSSTDYTLNAGDTMHITTSGQYSGEVTISGGVFYNCAAVAQNLKFTTTTDGPRGKAYNYGTLNFTNSNDHLDTDIYNYGTINKNNDMVMDVDGTLYNYGTLDITGKITAKVGGAWHNYGTLSSSEDLKIELGGTFHNYTGAIFSTSKAIIDGYLYNAGDITIATHYDHSNTGTVDIDGGCFHVTQNFINHGVINSLRCGTFFLNGGGGNNTGTIHSPLAIVNPDESSYPYLNSNSGSVDPAVTGVSCGCPGSLSIEVCNNGLDDDGDGLIDENDPQCFDTDGDGVLNFDDLDDDNDGLLDSEESQSSTELFTEFGIGNPVSGTGLYAVAGTNVSYASSFVGAECVTYDAGLQGPALYITKNSTTFTPLRFDFNNDVNNMSFKITDIDWNEEFDLYVYDENFNLYDLRTQGVVSLGSNILQNQPDGRRFSGQGPGLDHDGNDPANDGIGAAIFHFPGKVGTIVFNIRTHPGNSIRLTQMTFNVIDSDDDGVIDAWDLDSDNDGIYDVLEAGGVDPDMDGIIGTGAITDTDVDGWSDITDPDNGGTPLADADQDGDSWPNRLDPDSDADGCSDAVEAGFPDADGDGQLGGLVPPTVDAKGVVTSGGL
jgi:hypothetical protein